MLALGASALYGSPGQKAPQVSARDLNPHPLSLALLGVPDALAPLAAQ